jgi:serine/threonine protein kinase
MYADLHYSAKAPEHIEGKQTGGTEFYGNVRIGEFLDGVISEADSVLFKSAIGSKLYLTSYVLGEGGYGRVERVIVRRPGRDDFSFIVKTMLVTCSKAAEYALREFNIHKLLWGKAAANVTELQKYVVSAFAWGHDNVWFFQTPRTYYLFFPDIHTGDLWSVLNNVYYSRTYLREDVGRKIIVSLSIATKVVNALGVVHCDIKPENSLLLRDNTVRLIDFGLAVAEGTVSTPRGTPDYMNPEQLRGPGPHTFTAADDEYSLNKTIAKIQHYTENRPKPSNPIDRIYVTWDPTEVNAGVAAAMAYFITPAPPLPSWNNASGRMSMGAFSALFGGSASGNSVKPNAVGGKTRRRRNRRRRQRTIK